MQVAINPGERWRREFGRFLADTRGATAIEYAVLASCIGAVLAVIIVATGSNLRDGIYQKIYDAYPS